MNDRRLPPSDFASLVRQTIGDLSALADDAYAQQLADCIMEPAENPEEDEVLQAFRSPELVSRSAIAARFLIDHVNTIMRHRAGDAKAVGREMFRNKVGRERRILDAIIAGERAKKGQLDTRPNPRARAMDRLVQRHLAEFQDIYREEQAKVVAARKAARAEGKARAAAQRKAGGGGGAAPTGRRPMAAAQHS